ncbi:hypothetical protein GVN20_20250 [Runella sp. CRIBMP]|uniref:hypothetical protein n=1 Tax=Runella sp. CRIBMP TaxID=2683261 RepID=UPI0014121A53|nr:hypothetical protein [Runella sp. CRIBMP]NBB21707.1 hypothetical protein [Runella sp. CRIBMP]
MNRLSNFGDFALTRAEMKKVAGGSGTCRYWYEQNGERQYSTYTMSMDNAKKGANNIHVSNGGAGERTGYCCDSCPKNL